MKTQLQDYLQSYTIPERSFRPALFTQKEETEALLRGLPTTKFSTDFEDGLFESGDCPKREIAVLHNMREAFFYAREVCKRKLPEDVIYSAVYKALSHASKNYKPGFGIRFFAYAKVYVRSELSAEWREANIVRNAECVTFGSVESIDSEDYEATVGDAETVDPEFQEIFVRDMLEILRPVIETELAEQEKRVLELVYFNNLRLTDIAIRLRISPSSVSNSHQRALRKLRNILRCRRLFI